MAKFAALDNKMVAYLGNQPSSKLKAMLRLGQISVKEIAGISCITKNDPPDLEDILLEDLIGRCREALLK